MKNKIKKEIVVILHDIRSAENVGAMFRTADAGGVRKIYLTGYTPAPIDRFGRKRKDITKSALGAEEFIPWEQKSDIFSIIKKLKKEGFYVCAVEQDPKSINYKKANKAKKIGLIMGNEVSGLDKKTLSSVDDILEIPMFGQKESLNVSSALAVVLYGLVA